MHYTEHAKKRSQQRGFKYEYVDFILDHGRISNKPGGAVEVRLCRKGSINISSNKKQLLDKCKNKAVLLSGIGCVITLYNLR